MKLTRKKAFTIVELVIIIAIVGVLAAVLVPTFITLSNTNNQTQIFKVHVQTINGNTLHFEAKSWEKRDGGIEVKTTKDETMLLGDGTYLMYDTTKCPLCGHVTYK